MTQHALYIHYIHLFKSRFPFLPFLKSTPGAPVLFQFIFVPTITQCTGYISKMWNFFCVSIANHFPTFFHLLSCMAHSTDIMYSHSLILYNTVLYAFPCLFTSRPFLKNGGRYCFGVHCRLRRLRPRFASYLSCY